MEIKVRMSETDLLGHINNTSYFVYLETARIDFLEKIGCSVGGKGDRHVFLLASAACDFLQQGYFGQILEVKTKVKRLGNSSVTISSDIFDKESQAIIARGEGTLVFYDMVEQKSETIPNHIRRILENSIKERPDEKNLAF